MMRSGSYAAHLSRVRPQYRARRDGLLAALHRNFGLVEVSGEAGGLHVFWRFRPACPMPRRWKPWRAGVRVGVYTLASGGALDVRDTAFSRRGLILGYAALTPKQIEEGMARLARRSIVAVRCRAKMQRRSRRARVRRAARPPRAPAIWLPTIVSRRLYAGGTQTRAGSRRRSRPQTIAEMPARQPPSTAIRSRD